MARTLLSLTQEFCRRQALPIPASVINAQDDSTLQIWGLLNEGQADLADRYEWQEAQQQTTPFSSIGAGPSQYIAQYVDEESTATAGPFVGFKSLVPRTFWETTSRLEVYGPMTAQEWAYITSLLVQPTRYSWTMTNGALLIYPFNATAIFTFLYNSRYSVVSWNGSGSQTAASSPTQDAFELDTDFSVLPDRIVLQDLRWRWKAAKGLPYAEDARISESFILAAISRQPAPDIRMDGPDSAAIVGPGLYVVAGNTIPP